MMWGLRMDSNRDVDQHLLGNDAAGLGFFSDLTIIPHTTKERLEHHHRQNKMESQYSLVFDPAGELPNRAAPLVDNMGLLRVGRGMIFVYQDIRALDQRRRYAACASFPLNYVTTEDIAGDFERHPHCSERMRMLTRLLEGQQAVEKERERCRKKAEQREKELEEKKKQDVKDAARAAALAQAAVERVMAEHEKLKEQELVRQQQATELKAQIDKANGEAKTEARRLAKVARQAAEEARQEVAAAEEQVAVKVEEAGRAAHLEQQQKDEISHLDCTGPAYQLRVLKAVKKLATTIIRIDPTWMTESEQKPYPVKCQYFCQLLKEHAQHEKRGAIQFHEMEDLTLEDMNLIDHMVKHSDGRLRVAYHREGFKDAENQEPRVYGSVTITHHTETLEYRRKSRKRKGGSNKELYQRAPKVIKDCEQNADYVEAKGVLDRARMKPAGEALESPDKNPVREVMNDMDGFRQHETKGPAERTEAKRHLTRMEWQETWLRDVTGRLDRQLQSLTWIKPEYLPQTDEAMKCERTAVLGRVRDHFEASGEEDVFEKNKRRKLFVEKPSNWTDQEMRVANENARIATFSNPLLDKPQPELPGVGANVVKRWWQGRWQIEMQPTNYLAKERFRLGDDGVNREYENQAKFIRETRLVEEFTQEYRKDIAYVEDCKVQTRRGEYGDFMQARREEADRAMAAADEHLEAQAEARDARRRRQEAERAERRNATPVSPRREAAGWRDDQWRGRWRDDDWYGGWWDNHPWAAEDNWLAPAAAAAVEETERGQNAPSPKQGPPPKAPPPSFKAPPPRFTLPPAQVANPLPGEEALPLVDQLREALRLEELGSPGAREAPPGLPLPPPPPPMGKATQEGNQITAGVFTRPKGCAAAKETPQRD